MKSLLRLLVSMSLLGYVGLVAAEKPEPVALPTTVAAGWPASVLIDRGIPCATIVLSAEAGPAEKYAAANLQSVFQKMTGVRLAIAGDDRSIEGNRILIGNTRFTDAVVPANERKTLDKEGYIVRLHGRDLALAGGGPYGTIYAVDELYDRLGARWYLPGDLGEVIPHLDTIRFNPLDVRRTPSFAMRWVGDNVAWNLHNRTNRVTDARLPPAFVVYPGIYHTQSASFRTAAMTPLIRNYSPSSTASDPPARNASCAIPVHSCRPKLPTTWRRCSARRRASI